MFEFKDHQATRRRDSCTPITKNRASVFSVCFPKEVPDYYLPMDLGDDTDGVTRVGICIHMCTWCFDFDICGAFELVD